MNDTLVWLGFFVVGLILGIAFARGILSWFAAVALCCCCFGASAATTNTPKATIKARPRIGGPSLALTDSAGGVIEFINVSDSAWLAEDLTTLAVSVISIGQTVRVAFSPGTEGVLVKDMADTIENSFVVTDGMQQGLQLSGQADVGPHYIMQVYNERAQDSYEHAQTFDVMAGGGPLAGGFCGGFIVTLFLGFPSRAKKLAMLGMQGCLVGLMSWESQGQTVMWTNAGPYGCCCYVYAYDAQTNLIGSLGFGGGGGGGITCLYDNELVQTALPVNAAFYGVLLTADSYWWSGGCGVISFVPSVGDIDVAGRVRCQNSMITTFVSGCGTSWCGITCLANSSGDVIDLASVNRNLNPFGNGTNDVGTNVLAAAQPGISNILNVAYGVVSNTAYGLTNWMGTNGAFAAYTTNSVLGWGAGTYAGVDLWVTPMIYHGTNVSINPLHYHGGRGWDGYATFSWWIVLGILGFVMLEWGTEEMAEMVAWASALPSNFPGKEGMVSIVTWMAQVPIFGAMLLGILSFMMISLVGEGLAMVPVALVGLGVSGGAELKWAWDLLTQFVPITEVLGCGVVYWLWKVVGKATMMTVVALTGRYMT